MTARQPTELLDFALSTNERAWLNQSRTRLRLASWPAISFSAARLRACQVLVPMYKLCLQSRPGDTNRANGLICKRRSGPSKHPKVRSPRCYSCNTIGARFARLQLFWDDLVPAGGVCWPQLRGIIIFALDSGPPPMRH